MTNKQYSEDQLNDILNFIKKISPTSELIWGWEAGRFIDWKWGSNQRRLKKNPLWFSHNCQIFYDQNHIKSVLISEGGGKDACILTGQRNPEISGEVLKWAIENWAPARKGIVFEFMHNEYWLSSLMVKSCLKENPQAGHEWEYNLDLVPKESKLPEGYTLDSLKDLNDIDLAGIAEVVIKAFETGSDIDSYVNVLKKHRENPLYLPELNIFTRDPDGKITAYCRGTVNRENGICGIDPVCCHPDYFKKGLGKAVVQECFRKLKNMGGKLCYIGSAPMPAGSTYLYRSLSPQTYLTYSEWSLDL